MEKITARIILEVLGRPSSNVISALKMLLEKIEKEQGIAIVESSIHEPVEVKDSKDLFTSFSEITFKVENLSRLMDIMFAYMPAHVEVIEPEKMPFSNQDLNIFANKLMQRMHNYDAIAKHLLAERESLAKRLNELSPPGVKLDASSAVLKEKRTGRKAKSKRKK